MCWVLLFCDPSPCSRLATSTARLQILRRAAKLAPRTCASDALWPCRTPFIVVSSRLEAVAATEKLLGVIFVLEVGVLMFVLGLASGMEGDGDEEDIGRVRADRREKANSRSVVFTVNGWKVYPPVRLQLLFWGAREAMRAGCELASLSSSSWPWPSENARLHPEALYCDVGRIRVDMYAWSGLTRSEVGEERRDVHWWRDSLSEQDFDRVGGASPLDGLRRTIPSWEK